MSSKRDYNYIERLILESFIQGEEDGQDLDMYLHSKIDEIEKEIEKIIYQFEDNGDIYIFDSLEINLEFNSFSSLREDLIKSLSTVFSEKLITKIGEAKNNPLPQKIISPTQLDISIIAYFLENGVMPQKFMTNDNISINEIFRITISTESSLGKIIQLINKTDSTKNRFTNQISIRNQVHLLNKINEKKNFLLGQKIKWLPKKWLSDNKQLKIKTLLKKELIQLSEAIEYLYPKAESQGKNKTRLKKENISEGIFNIIKEEKPREIKKETTRIIEEKPILKKENPQKLMSFINDLGYENIDEEELELFLNKILIKDYKKIFYRIRSKRMIDDSNIELFNFISLETIHTIMELQGKNKIKPYFNILSESIKEGKIKAAINYETLLHQAKGENKKDVFIYIESIVRSSEKYNTNLLAPIVETIKEEIKKQQKENIDDKTSNKIKKEQLKQTIEILDVIKEQNEKEPERKILSNDKQIYNTLVQEGLFVQNVGLVLLWPFFTRFFRLTGVLEKGTKQFQSKEQSIKAIFLLEYLATKRTEAEEHELILNKILCGVPLTESVPLSYELTEEEKNIANSLLGAVVAQWKALKSTSPDGLRGAFLFREGRIMREGSNYRVTVERKTLDILINKMPWSFAMIKLPWLNDLIFVEWT